MTAAHKHKSESSYSLSHGVNPTDVRLLCADAQVAHARHGANFVQQLGLGTEGFANFDGDSGKHPSIIRIDASKKSCNRFSYRLKMKLRRKLR